MEILTILRSNIIEAGFFLRHLLDKRYRFQTMIVSDIERSTTNKEKNIYFY